MTDKTRVVQYGLGPIGAAVAAHTLDRAALELVGGVDIDPAKVGKDVGTVIGAGRLLGFPVVQDLAGVLDHRDADVVLHATGSYIEGVRAQILETLAAGLDVVSTAEELSFPWLAHPLHAAEIDAAARDAGRTVLATGVNPGFIMDSLPLALTAVCQRVDHVAVRRAINASTRRGPFQKKIGCGLTLEEFERKMEAGSMGHVGLPESMGMIFDTLGWDLTDYQSHVTPVMTGKRIKTEHVEVAPDQVKGLRQVARGRTDGEELVHLTFIAELEADDEGDTIRITGRPNLEVKLKGTNGDIATVAIVVNAIPRVRQAAPGLLTMRDVPVVTAW